VYAISDKNWKVAMNSRTLRLLAVGLIVAGPIAANAQVTTLEYQGGVMFGSSTYLPNGYTCPGSSGSDVTCLAPLPTAPVVARIDGTLVIDKNNTPNGGYYYGLASILFTLSGRNGADFSTYITLPNGGYFGGGPGSQPELCGVDGCIDLIISRNGAIVGASIDLSSSDYNSTETQWDIDRNGGSSINYLYALDGTCQTFVPITGPPGGPYPPYTGGTINPCTVVASSTKAGVWRVTTVPEIDPLSAASGLTLLLGGFVVLSGRGVRS
jgi:hypothetical protein